MPLFLFPLIFAGIVAYYTCFWPGARPGRRIVLGIFLPALLSLGLIFSEFLFGQSVLDRRMTLAVVYDQLSVIFKEHPSGFSFASIALVMLGVFAVRIQLGLSSLPLRLSRQPVERQSEGLWNKIEMLIFVLVCPLFLLSRIVNALVSLPFWHRPDLADSNLGLVYGALWSAFGAAVLVFVAVLVMGEYGRKAARASLQLPELRFALFGLGIPIVISFLISFFQYGYDRAQWAAHDFGKFSPPQLAAYFAAPSSWRWSLLLMIFAAFAEEIVFRGLLLHELLGRYGLYRGIFVTGMIWAAFHFHSDMHFRYSISGALVHIVSRILICLAMNFVLSWMTLRCNSIIPAAIAHTVSNVLIVGGITANVPFAGETRILLWALAAWLLFRYWPVEGEVRTIGAPPASFQPSV